MQYFPGKSNVCRAARFDTANAHRAPDGSLGCQVSTVIQRARIWRDALTAMLSRFGHFVVRAACMVPCSSSISYRTLDCIICRHQQVAQSDGIAARIYDSRDRVAPLIPSAAAESSRHRNATRAIPLLRVWVHGPQLEVFERSQLPSQLRWQRSYSRESIRDKHHGARFARSLAIEPGRLPPRTRRGEAH